MPSASPDSSRGGFLLRYRPPGERRQVQLRARPEWRVASLEAARALAAKLDRASRILDGTDDGLGDPDAARRLLERHGLDPGQGHGRAPATPALGTGTALLALFSAHPATRRDNARPRYEAHLAEFIAWSGISNARHLTADAVERWIEELHRRGQSYDTRRHRLIPIRRACAQLARETGRNPLAGIRLDRRPARGTLEAAPLEEILRLVRHEDPRIAAAAGLMGAMGLRPTEALRVRGKDLRPDGLLEVGWKTASSWRLLPAPAPLLPVLSGRAADEPLVASRHNTHRGGMMTPDSFWRAWKSASPYPAKLLRKGFLSASVLELGLDPLRVEAYMGHRVSGLTAVSGAHYLSIGAAALRPVAEAWAKALL
jgi:hypothetical protein